MILVLPGWELAEAGGLHEPTSPGSCMRVVIRFFLHCIVHVVDIHALNTHSETTTTTTRLRRCARFFCVSVLLSPSGRHVAAWRTRRRLAAKTATPALMVAT